MAAVLTSSLLSTALLAGGIGASAIGTGMQMAGARAATDAQRKAERLRQSAMEIDARRKSMEAIRNEQRARAMALTTTTAQGAAGPGGSALPGAYGQVAGQTGNVLGGIQGSLELGRGMFNANQALFQAQSMQATGQGFQQLGSTALSSLDAFGRLSRNFGGSSASSSFSPSTDFRMGFASPWQRV